MPGGGGLYILERLKAMAIPPLIIVWTGYSSTEYRQKCLDLGAAYFFSKAGEIDQLLELLQQLQLEEMKQATLKQ
jgi:DNA-binding NarL/FixJ family response regulator